VPDSELAQVHFAPRRHAGIFWQCAIAPRGE
jgi:hypothetical protein